MIYFTAHTINCVCHSIRTMFRVLGINNLCLGLKSLGLECPVTHNKARLVKAEALFNVCQFEHAMVHFHRGMVSTKMDAIAQNLLNPTALYLRF